MICRLLSIALLLLLPVSLSLGAAEESQEYTPPKLISRLEVPIAENLRHLHLQNPMVVYRVIVNPDGTLLDSLAVEATHHELLEPAEKKLATAKFRPASMDGKPVTGKMTIAVSFFDPVQRAWKRGGIAIPAGSSGIEGVDRRMNLGALNKIKYVESLPNELDEPLRILETQFCMVHPPDEPMPKGQVIVEYYVNHHGKVRLPEIVKTDGKYLSLSALETLQRTSFVPPSRNGIPTHVKVRQPFNFD